MEHLWGLSCGTCLVLKRSSSPVAALPTRRLPSYATCCFGCSDCNLVGSVGLCWNEFLCPSTRLTYVPAEMSLFSFLPARGIGLEDVLKLCRRCEISIFKGKAVWNLSRELSYLAACLCPKISLAEFLAALKFILTIKKKSKKKKVKKKKHLTPYLSWIQGSSLQPGRPGEGLNDHGGLSNLGDPGASVHVLVC